MRIRTQTILMIAPIFAVLGVVIGLVVYAKERSEVIWGIGAEATALGVTVAEFAEAGQFVGETPEQRNRNLRQRLRPLLKSGRVQRVRFYLFAGLTPVLAADSADEGSPPPEANDFLEALAKGAAVSRIRESELGIATLSCLTPIGSGFEFVEVSIDAGRAREHSGEVIRHCLKLGGALFAAGVILSIGISGFLTRRLKRLEQAAREVAAGDYDLEIEPQSVREINDLGSTFNTMSSILRDLVGKAKKDLVDAELYRNSGDLAATFRGFDGHPNRFLIGRYEVLFQKSGDSPSGAFSGVVEKNGVTRFVLGAVMESDPLQATIEANAAIHFFLNLLGTESSASTLERARAIFDFRECAILEHHRGESLSGVQSGGGFLPATRFEFEEAAPLMITTAGDRACRRIRRFIDSTGRLSGRELNLLMAGQPVAGFLIIQPAEPGASTTRAGGPARYRNRRAVLRTIR